MRYYQVTLDAPNVQNDKQIESPREKKFVAITGDWNVHEHALMYWSEVKRLPEGAMPGCLLCPGTSNKERIMAVVSCEFVGIVKVNFWLLASL